MKIAVSHVWKPPEANPGALQAGAHGYETVSLCVGWLLPGEEFSPTSSRPWAVSPSFGLLASGNQQRKLEWCGFSRF